VITVCCDDVGPRLQQALLLLSPSAGLTRLESNYTFQEIFRYIRLTFIGSVFV